MRILYILYVIAIVAGATTLNYRQADGAFGGNPVSSGGGRLGSGTYGSSHK